MRIKETQHKRMKKIHHGNSWQKKSWYGCVIHANAKSSMGIKRDFSSWYVTQSPGTHSSPKLSEPKKFSI